MKDCHRVGFGFDSHTFGAKGSLRLGGVRFPGHASLKGHSDGDAVLHAIIDSLLGAAGLGDIGDMFPDTSKKYKGASSRILLGQVMGRLKKKKMKPVHIDLTVVADKPKLGPAKKKIQKTISGLLKIPSSAINIKAKTPEGLCLFKPPGGVLVWSVATLRFPS